MALTLILRTQPSSIDCKDCDFVSAAQTSGTIYLLDPATNPVGSRKVVKKTSARGTITVQSMAGTLIDGAASYTLSAQWKYAEVVSDGSQWLIVGSN